MSKIRIVRYSGIDPTRIKDRIVGGPPMMTGWAFSNGERIFNEDRTRMWFTSILKTCWDEGLNYEGHKIA